MKWFLAILLLIGLAIALQAGLVAFAGYVLLGSYLVSRWLARRWSDDLTAERRCNNEPREVGDTLEVEITLRNTGTLPILWVLVEDLLPERSFRRSRFSVKGKRVHVVNLRPRQTRPINYKLTF